MMNPPSQGGRKGLDLCLKLRWVDPLQVTQPVNSQQGACRVTFPPPVLIAARRVTVVNPRVNDQPFERFWQWHMVILPVGDIEKKRRPWFAQGADHLVHDADGRADKLR